MLYTEWDSRNYNFSAIDNFVSPKIFRPFYMNIQVDRADETTDEPQSRQL